jgi:hypothetical protein
VTWVTSDASLISASGVVTRPSDKLKHKVTLYAKVSKAGMSMITESLEFSVLGTDYAPPQAVPGFSLICFIEGGANDGKLLYDGTFYNPPPIKVKAGENVRFRIAYCNWSDGDYDNLVWTVNGNADSSAFNYRTMLLNGRGAGSSCAVVLSIKKLATGYVQSFVPVTIDFME